MNEKLKHLEFIQNIITRMNTNSFMIKGWSVTLVSALFALAASKGEPKYILIAYIPVLTFWILDGYFLSQERQYRELFKVVSAIPMPANGAPSPIDFNLDASRFNHGRQSWAASAFSSTLSVFHGGLFNLVFFVTCSVIARYVIKIINMGCCSCN